MSSYFNNLPEEQREWYLLTPQERWEVSQELWQTFLTLGGSLDPEPDTQSPFFDSSVKTTRPIDGGQACVLYGAAEFTRDIDIHLLLDQETAQKFDKILELLQGKTIAIPEFNKTNLDKGHAVHFRLEHPDVKGIRLDIMSKMRGVDTFDSLWNRRSEIELLDGTIINLLSLPDLVNAKKTQLDKDWPMVRRLVEADYFSSENTSPSAEKIKFWFLELRTASLILELCNRFPQQALEHSNHRKAIKYALTGQLYEVEIAIKDEEELERKKDKEYWEPLKKELEYLRISRNK